MNESTMVIETFRKANTIDQGIPFIAMVIVHSGYRCIYEEETTCYISENKYGDLEVTIDWNLAEKTWRALNLKGVYYGKFDDFKIVAESLTIQKEDMCIRIEKRRQNI